MRIIINENKIDKIVETFLNNELERLKIWIYSIDDFSDFYGEYDESYFRGIERADKFDVTEITKFDSNWIIHVIIHSNVGDFDWEWLIYEMERSLEKIFKLHIDITVDGYKWSKRE